ncbi:MAG: glutamate--tRNA ligase [Candidatus Omnitrophica bacterium]|nr:glutamate--tRNA ligase [Candidatus Omnitrophota bacterium]
MVKVRFAPSPTGFLHIGGARTALFNWMYARSQNGTFILRIEDTDQQRSKKEFEDEILMSMKWLGFDWDELHYQSKRFDIYKEYAQKLLNEGKAYKDGEAIILKMIPDQQIKMYDLIRDEITFDSSELKDQVLMKSDGSPAYNFCCVIDDALMEITHVIRGEDHISNTPKQLMIYNALEWKAPKYAHLPLILDDDGARLSKRFGAVAVSDYKEQGFISEALVNYLMLLGWSPGKNQEKATLQDALKNFSIKKINKAGAVFSIEKLKWLNNQYFKEMATNDLIKILVPYLEKRNFPYQKLDQPSFEKIVQLYKGRLNVLSDFIDWADYAFVDDLKVDESLKEKYFTKEIRAVIKILSQKLENSEDFSDSKVEEIFKKELQDLGHKPSDYIHPVRVALTAKEVGPSLFQIMSILGKKITIDRLNAATI